MHNSHVKANQLLSPDISLEFLLDLRIHKIFNVFWANFFGGIKPRFISVNLVRMGFIMPELILILGMTKLCPCLASFRAEHKDSLVSHLHVNLQVLFFS
jgi:hypothetical protein